MDTSEIKIKTIIADLLIELILTRDRVQQLDQEKSALLKQMEAIAKKEAKDGTGSSEATTGQEVKVAD